MSCLGSSSSILDVTHSGFSLFLRSYCRIGSILSVYGMARCDSALFVLDFIHLGLFDVSSRLPEDRPVFTCSWRGLTRTAVISAGSHSPGVLAIATRLCTFGIVTISVWNEQDRICVATPGLRTFGLELVVAGTSLSRIFDFRVWHDLPRLLTASPGFCAS